MTKTYIIQDWSGNVIRQKTNSGLWIVPEFSSFEDGWGYIRENCPDEDSHEDLYVLEKGGR